MAHVLFVGAYVWAGAQGSVGSGLMQCGNVYHSLLQCRFFLTWQTFSSASIL